MNFRTTMILITIVAALALVMFFTRDRAGSSVAQQDQGGGALVADTSRQGEKLLDLSEASVTSLNIVPGTGDRIALERRGMEWRLTSPVDAPAESSTVSRLVGDLSALASRGSVRLDAASSSSTGLDQPRFRVELVTTDGKSVKLDFGERSATGDNVYVRRNDDGDVRLVESRILDDLDKPASSFRRTRLLDVQTGQVTQLRIDAKGSQPVALRKSDGKWKIVEPSVMPADERAVSDVLFALAGVQANEFVAESVQDAKRRGLEEPVITVSYGMDAPQPTTALASAPTTVPAMTMVKFGGFSDVTKRHVFAIASTSPALATVSASTLDGLRKTPLDLRDREILSVDPATVNRIAIVRDEEATTRPTTRPASHSEHTIARAQLSTTAPTAASSISPTQDPTSQPSTQETATTAPAATKPAPKWRLADSEAPVNESRTDSLLARLHPLRVTRFLDTDPTTRPSAEQITLTVDTISAGGASMGQHTIRFTVPADGQDAIGVYNGLTFVVDPPLLDALRGDFTATNISDPQNGTSSEIPAGIPPARP